MAMRSYEDRHGQLPPAVVYGEDGRPLHSWRVLILPFIGEEDLHRQFKMDEPWDSRHNSQLLSKMPAMYSAPPSKARTMLPSIRFVTYLSARAPRSRAAPVCGHRSTSPT